MKIRLCQPWCDNSPVKLCSGDRPSESTALINRDWTGKNLQLIQEASRHAEAKLAAQIQLAVSADARASILAGIYATAATGCILALATNKTLQASHTATAAIVSATLFFAVGAVLCVWAAWPCDFRSPGNDPSTWYGDIEEGVSIEKAAGDQLQLSESDIRENNATLTQNARRLQAGIVVGIAAPIIGLLAGSTTSYFQL